MNHPRLATRRQCSGIWYVCQRNSSPCHSSPASFGRRHERFQSILTAISPEGAKKVAEVAAVLVPEEMD
jgi:hypothetical protein